MYCYSLEYMLFAKRLLGIWRPNSVKYIYRVRYMLPIVDAIC